MAENSDDNKKTKRAVARIIERVVTADAAHSRAKTALEQAEKDKSKALYAFFDAVADGRKQLKALKKTSGKDPLKAALKGSRKDKTKDTKSNFTKLLLASAPGVPSRQVSKYAGVIEYAMEYAAEGRTVSDLIREKGGIKKVDQLVRKKNKKRK